LDVSTKRTILKRGGIALALVGAGLIGFSYYQQGFLLGCDAGQCFTTSLFVELLGFLILCVGVIGHTIGQNLPTLEYWWSMPKAERMAMRKAAKKMGTKETLAFWNEKHAELDGKHDEDKTKDENASSN
jgi:hypothetical protein